MKLLTSLIKWMFSGERRRALRQNVTNLKAHYWDGAAPLPHKVRDISSTGLYLETEQRWYPGTIVILSLQRLDAAASDPDRFVMVNAKVVRFGADGIGFSIVMNPNGSQKLHAKGADRKTFKSFFKRLQDNSGQALIEYALMLPFLFLLIVNVVNFGGFFFSWITVANAARAGGDYAILAGASAGFLTPATATQVSNLIAQDASSLPNGASLSVNICQNNNGTIITLSGTCSSIPSDPEAASFVLTSIDVTYTYVPFIPAGFQFPNLSIYATIPPTSIHRRAVMRVIQ